MFILKLFIIFANDSLVSILIGIYADYICKKSSLELDTDPRRA